MSLLTPEASSEARHYSEPSIVASPIVKSATSASGHILRGRHAASSPLFRCQVAAARSSQRDRLAAPALTVMKSLSAPPATPSRGCAGPALTVHSVSGGHHRGYRPRERDIPSLIGALDLHRGAMTCRLAADHHH
jgi:hypothetical protein